VALDKDEVYVSELISPYNGSLVDLIVPEQELGELRAYASELPSLQLSTRSVCDLELLAIGAFTPLRRFMNKADYQQVLEDMRLATGVLFPIPITLPVDQQQPMSLDRDIALRDARNELLAVLTIEDIYEWKLDEVATRVFGTQDPRHPLVAEMHRWGKLSISGHLRVIQLPRHYDFQSLRFTPSETRARLKEFGKPNIVAFQTRNPLHRVHEEMTKLATKKLDGVLLLHPVVGMTKPGDIDHYTRVRTYKILSQHYYDANRILLSLLPLAMRMAGPREALWHAIIRRNYGANHLIVGRDHASPGLDSNGEPFYTPYGAQELVEQFSQEIGVGMIQFQELAYLPDEKRYEQVSDVSSRQKVLAISGTEAREEYLSKGRKLPEWFCRPEVNEVLAEAYPPKHRQGACVWFTGLSGAGKSTTADVLTVKLLECGRQVTVLDGDTVRTHLSKGLTFNKEDRDTNIRRIGFVAAEIVRHGGLVIAAAVSPYRATRNEVRALVGKERFFEVFVDTPLEVCEQRDTKGMYAKARRGDIKGLTGIDDPYEPPLDPEITLDAVGHSPEENARLVLAELIAQGFVRNESAQ
jgi:sulfate adenylyltransferase